nr:polysaccharide biosynthesis/export family protein [Chthonobacter rhizosphaerae]
MKRSYAALTAAIFLTSCATLPSSGPSASDIVDRTEDSAALDRYEVVDVSDRVLAALRSRPNEKLAGSFGGARGGTSDAIGVGDFVTVTIWEAGNGGLFSAPVGSVTSGNKSVTIPEQPVTRAGTISIPYAGTVTAAGRTPEQVKSSIEQALSGKAIEPQVLVSVTRPLFNTATVTGEVTRGGRVPLSARGDTILDVIASAGGISAPVHETFVQLQRGRQTIRVPLQQVVDNPQENITLSAGDTLTLTRDPQTFTAFGATGRNAEIPFSAKGIALNEAIAKAGGLLDNRADPSGVFLFRSEPAEVVRLYAPQSRLAARGGHVPVVYRLDLQDPKNLFLAQSFPVFDKDMLYVSAAPANELAKFLGIVNLAVGTVRSGAGTYTNLSDVE